MKIAVFLVGLRVLSCVRAELIPAVETLLASDALPSVIDVLCSGGATHEARNDFAVGLARFAADRPGFQFPGAVLAAVPRLLVDCPASVFELALVCGALLALPLPRAPGSLSLETSTTQARYWRSFWMATR